MEVNDLVPYAKWYFKLAPSERLSELDMAPTHLYSGQDKLTQNAASCMARPTHMKVVSQFH